MDRKSTPTKYESQSRERIVLLIAEYCDGSQQQLCERTGVSKASISQYVNGRNVPSNLTAKKICEPFGINPAWIMGFDVPKKLTDISSLSSSTTLSASEQRILDDFRQLNGEGQDKLMDYADDLVSLGRYKKHDQYGMAEEA